ncbi:MAG: hypothetical protein ABI895_00600 [Deltaproteobacteria bacterium]
MIKHLSILPLFALLICSACDDSQDVKLPKDDTTTSAAKDKDGKSEDPETRDLKTSTGSSSESTPNPTGAFERKLDSLVTQKAPWGDIEISVEKARELRGSKPEGFPTAVKHSTTSVYAIVDLKLESNGDEENDYKERDTWDLILKDGSRSKPLAPLGVVLAPGGTKSASLFYKLEDNAKLEGASLEINGSDRALLEPLPIPLDQKTEFASQVKLSNLVGETFSPDDDSSLRFEILDAVYGVNLEATGRRAPRDQRLVQLKVRVGYEGDDDKISFSATDDAPRISINGKTFVPDAFDTKTIESGETHDFVMVYPIAETASRMDLVLDAGTEEMATDIELPSLLDGDTTQQDDEVDSQSDDSDDEFDSSDDDSDDSFDDDSDDDSDDEFDSSDDDSDDSFDDSDDSFQDDDWSDDSDEDSDD